VREEHGNMARRVKIDMPEARNLARDGLLNVLNNFKLRPTLLQMEIDGDLDDWYSVHKENSFKGKMQSESDLLKKAIYCAILYNFEDIV
jgi:hypothetical protein